MHSAHDWREVLEPIVARYGQSGARRYFRGDAAGACLEVYQSLEEHGLLYAIRLPDNEERYSRPIMAGMVLGGQEVTVHSRGDLRPLRPVGASGPDMEQSS